MGQIFNSYLEKSQDWPDLNAAGIKEVILQHKFLSRFGTLNDQSLGELLLQAKSFGVRALLQWDLLMDDAAFQRATETLSALPLDLIAAVRVQDPGAFEYMRRQFPHIKLQLILETGHHNLEGILGWSLAAGEQLERLILSSELPKGTLAKIVAAKISAIEILVWGPILLFYSPRFLLTPLNPNKKPKSDQLFLAHSEESPHRGFPVLENSHGTFMFNTKDLFLLDCHLELESLGINFGRIDLRFGRPLEMIRQLSSWKDSSSQERQEIVLNLKDQYPYKIHRGYFSVNKSDVLFDKLTNSHIRGQEDGYVGEVIDVQKGQFVAIRIRSHQQCLQKGDRIQIRNTEGKIFSSTVSQLKNSHGEDRERATGDDLALINYIAGVTVKSIIYSDSKNSSSP